jgi:PAS domain S-box-containing protein
MLILKSQIETTPAFMGAVLRLPFDQKFLIRKQVPKQCGYISTRSLPRVTDPFRPFPAGIDGYTCESSPSRLRTFVASTFVPAGNRGRLFICRAIILLVVVCLHSSVGIALDPTSHISQYGHSVWRAQDGYFGGAPSAIAQTTDGYIWVRTYSGLFRFDGVQFVRWSAQSGEEFPSTSVNFMLGARDGSLWVGTEAGLAHLVNGRLTLYEKGWVSAPLIEDRDGKIWFLHVRPGDRTHPLCQVLQGEAHCYGNEDGLDIPGSSAMAQDASGDLWVGSDRTLVKWRPNSSGSSKVYRPQTLQSHAGIFGVAGITRAADGSVWVGIASPGTGGGLQHLVNSTLKPFLAPKLNGETLTVTALLSDHQENLWVGTLHGLYKIRGKNVDLYGTAEGLSGDVVTKIFEDREGNIWVATSGGLDMFRDLRVKSISTREGLNEDAVESVAAARDGRVWVGTSGLQVIEPGGVSLDTENAPPGNQVTGLFVDRAAHLWMGMDNKLFVREGASFRQITKPNGSPLGMIFGIAEDSDRNIWVEAKGPPGTLVRIRGLKIQEMFPPPKTPFTGRIVADPQRGIWLGLWSGNLGRFRDGKVQTFSFGEHPNFFSLNFHFLAITAATDGSILGGTPSGVVAWKDGKQQILSKQNGLPCNYVSGLITDDAGNLWLFAQCGLIEIPRDQMRQWWEHPESKLNLRVFDTFDGFRSGVGHFNTSAKTPDGRLWFANGSVLQVIDPAHVSQNIVPPPVKIHALVADHKEYPMDSGIKLPALTRDLEIDYTALSYAAPQKVLFRYMLEGRDSGFQEAGTRRQAFYNDLRPGHYRFHVIACNNDGVWNEVGASLGFSVLPAYYQTTWFRALWAAAFLAILWAAYQVRVRRLRSEEQKFREAVETMPALAFIARSDGQRTFVNSRWVEYTGLTEKQALGWGWQDAVHPNDLSRALTTWQESQASGNTLEYEARILRSADGDYRWFQTRAVPVRDKRGKIVKWYGVINDIEDRKRVEQLQADLAHVNRVSTMGELTASLAHEIKQPIGAAVTNAEACARLLDRGQPDVFEAREAALEVVKDAGRAAHIIDRVRSLYRKGSSQMDSVDVNELIGEMLLILHNEAHRHSVNVVTYVADGLPKVMADRVQLQQVLMNLMLNGIQAMEDTGGVLTIKAQLPQDVQVQISVSDTGVGLPADKADHIFEAFFTTKPEGSGMGLAISRSIIESHGGRVWASANSGKGATFHFTLPLAPHFMPR